MTPEMLPPREHGGGLDEAVAAHGGSRADWLDLSTGINPHSYPLPEIPAEAWTALPDRAATKRLEQAARRFWSVPDAAGVLAAPGASVLIAHLPRLLAPGRVRIPARTYNEHEAAFRQHGWKILRADPDGAPAEARVVVHPNNPTGQMFSGAGEPPTRPLLVIDESFCDLILHNSRVCGFATRSGTVILKSFGKFWGLAGLRLGFAIGDPALIGRLKQMLGPWPVSGVAQHLGAVALEDMDWANDIRQQLLVETARLDAVFEARGAELVGGTALFRLFRVDDARAWQARLARGRVWTRAFASEPTWLRVGLPPGKGWAQLERALG